MKKITSFLLIFLILISVFTGCVFAPSVSIGDSAKVNFYVDGELYETKSVKRGEAVETLAAPSKENQVFVGWYMSGLIVGEYDFSSPVYLDIDLHAQYVIDAIEATDMVNELSMLSVVTVHNRSFNLALGGLIESDHSTSQGSGVVINISGGYCYVLTNCHVAKTLDGFENSLLKVEDPWGNVYEAQIYKHKNKTEKAISEDYDLALLCFPYQPQDEHRLMHVGIAKEDPVVDEYVISIGSPEGLKNTVSFGKVSGYGKVNVEEEGELERIGFDVIIHTANINHGSSGGPLLNLKGELVGLNFAGFASGNSGCAIPMSKITEFLNTYVYLK